MRLLLVTLAVLLARRAEGCGDAEYELGGCVRDEQLADAERLAAVASLEGQAKGSSTAQFYLERAFVDDAEVRAEVQAALVRLGVVGTKAAARMPSATRLGKELGK